MDPQMEQLLEMMAQPVFLVRDGSVFWHNEAAKELVSPGQEIGPLFGNGRVHYDLWDRKGILETAVSFYGREYHVRIRVSQQEEIFVLSAVEETSYRDGSSLQDASTRLRGILHELIASSFAIQDHLGDNEEAVGEAETVNRSLYRLLRLCGRLSEQGEPYGDGMVGSCERMDVAAFLEAFFREAAPLLEESGRSLEYTPFTGTVYGNLDRHLMKKALYSLLCIALRHSPRGAAIRLRGWKEGKQLCFSLIYGSGMEQEEADSADHGDFAMARVVAGLHGGTLITLFGDKEEGTRVILSIRKEDAMALKSQGLRVDPYGGFHAGLVELSEVMERKLYHPDRL